MGRPKTGIKTERVSIQLSALAAEELRKLAREKKLTLGAVVEQLLHPLEELDTGAGAAAQKELRRYIDSRLKDLVTKPELQAALERAARGY